MRDLRCQPPLPNPLTGNLHASIAQCARTLVVGAVAVLALAVIPRPSIGDEEGEYFETHVRPLLASHCYECHGPEKQSAGLRLDSRAAIVKGGDSGAAITPGKASESLLIAAINRTGDIQMPPDDPLSSDQIAVLTRWVDGGAYWPADDRPTATSVEERARAHWAFQPIREPDVPSSESTLSSQPWGRNPVDAFILARLQAAGLRPAPEADRATLMRRAYYSVIGLPPTYDEIMAFVQDPDPSAYERLIDRLLDSPHYGEQWARHWLDVARYADTKGYVYAREERFWTHAWVYRDWVVRALNEDMSYDRFLLLQMAADQVSDCRPDDLAAMGYLTLGRRFLGVKHDVIDDRIDVVCRGTMGLTVGCARCHDHKYDPIPTSDYYSLYGVFDSSVERSVPLGDPARYNDAFRQGLAERQQKLHEATDRYRSESANYARKNIGRYLQAQLHLDRYPAEGFDQILEVDDLYPAFVRQWEAYLREAHRRHDPVFRAWHAFAALDPASFADQAVAIVAKLQQLPADALNPLVKQQFQLPPATMQEVVERYTQLFEQVSAQGDAHVAQSSQQSAPEPTELEDVAAEQVRRILYGEHSPCEVPDAPIVVTETFFTTSHCEELWKLQGEVDRWIIQAGEEAPHVVALFDAERPKEPRLFRRGNAVQKGNEVPRQFLNMLSGDNRQPFRKGSGRLEMAQAIIDPSNPLTSRVLVNRIWRHHFGSGLVTTPSDFGTRASAPSHPELLDWLASRFVAEGWSLKTLHRYLLLSSAFRQASDQHVTDDVRELAQRVDPDNRLLWHANRRRLTFEEMRDTLLAVTGDLQRQLGGKPADMLQSPFPQRRAIYGLVDRQFLPGTLRTFDFANPDLHIPQRSETTVPQQALFFLNHPFMLEQTRRLATLTTESPDDPLRIQALFRRALLRDPTEDEVADAMTWLRHADDSQSDVVSASVAAWSYGYGPWDETAGQVASFTNLPHFTGNSWQGGGVIPDPTLGWVQLTAQGGHPGNDRQHASIRRWTAPADMTVRIASTLTHEEEPGDGVRAFVACSRHGQLGTASVHQSSAELNVESLMVSTGDTVDFVVDIGDVLHSDQYLWPVKITTIATGETSSPREPSEWDATADFTPNTANRLNPWEQLIHVILCTNEFVFVD